MHLSGLVIVFIEDVDAFFRVLLEVVQLAPPLVSAVNVQELLGQPEKPIVGISLVPEMSTIIRIAKIPNHRTVGIVTTSEQFRKIIREVMEELELVFDMFLETSSQERQIVQQLVDRCDVVLVSPKRRQLVEELSPPGCQAIEFVFTPDRTSINNLKVALLELNDGGRIKERN